MRRSLQAKQRRLSDMVGDITLTDRAAEKIQKLLSGTSKGSGLRVKVVEGGCSGFEYQMIVGEPAAEDRVFERNGARIFLDPKSMLHLNGTELDYKDSLMQSGFVFNNPNVKGTCGCGTSFAV
jgi:iron-sulfur cluster assembly protein